MRRIIIAALPFMLVTATAAAQAPSSDKPPSGGTRLDSTGQQGERKGPLDRVEREGLGPEGTDLGSAATRTKPVTVPATGIRTTDELQFSVKQVLVGARRVNELEVQAAKLAQERAQGRAVKKLAADIVRDDQATNARLMAYARKHDLDLGTGADQSASEAVDYQRPVPSAGQPDPAHPTSDSVRAEVGSGPFAQPAGTLEEQAQELRRARGAAFDGQFAQMTAAVHQQTLASIATASESAGDPELKQALETWRASVQKHLDAAQALGAGGQTHGRRAPQTR